MWCWHRIRESESGLCPACRTPYGEDPHQFSAVDVEEVLKANKEKEAAAKREKQQSQAGKENETILSAGTDLTNQLAVEAPKDRSALANMRVIRRNLIYAVGLPPSAAVEEILRRPEYFGQYGKIAKIVINRANAAHTSAAEARRASASAYVTFQHKEDTLACILALDGFYLENRNIRASYGTSKYCSAFIKSVRCNNPECTYLHEMGASEDTFTKQEIQAGYVTSGRDVLARQQQILAEQIRLQQLSAGNTGATTHSLPRKRIGGGGPSGTGKAAIHPIFPPPEYDEAAKPPPTATAQSAVPQRTITAPGPTPGTSVALSPGLNPTNVTAKMGRSVSVGNAVRAPAMIQAGVGVPSTGTNNPQRKPQSLGMTVATTAAAVVAAGKKETSDMQQNHTMLTALTPLKRTSVTKAVSTGTVKMAATPRSASSSPTRSMGTEEKLLGSFLLRNGKKEDASQSSLLDFDDTTSPCSLVTDTFSGSIGGDVIGQPIAKSAGVSVAPARLLAGLASSSDPVIVGPLSGHSNNNIASVGGFTIPMSDSRGGLIPSSLSRTLGGEIFDGPLSNDYSSKAAIGSSNDKWHVGIGGAPLTQPNNPNAVTSRGVDKLGNGNPLWLGASTGQGANGIIGGQRPTSGQIGGSNSTSALASILGINLPTGTGSLQESSSLWSPQPQLSFGPSPISALNNSSIGAHPNHMDMLTGTNQPGNSMNNVSGAPLIGGATISGGIHSGYGGPGPVGGGNAKNDIALLQSLLPGVHITSDSNNPMLGFNSGNTGWGVVPTLSHHGIGGETIHASGNWAGPNMAHQGHLSSTIGAIGQHPTQRSQRQQGPGIW
jgi:CCR4-NOT transcription complex subunit 4